ncbi:MAG TPA: MBOAT family O-acyltransferase [Xanthobacteraceae bacterium]|nr:MBOAT family O-acyltransferase [Xanthobacteraceae bacterium]
MLFTSLVFFIFLPLVLAVFRIVPVVQRWAVLLLASYVFYGFLHPFNLVYLGAVTLVIYVCGHWLQRAEQASLRAAVLAGGLVVVLGSLTAFKFYDFAAGQIIAAELVPHLSLPRLGVTAPAGFSFYAFSAASYLIDIYAGRLTAPQKLAGTALFVAYFPKIFAGPIERATTFLPQLWAGLRSDPKHIVFGLQLIGWGLFKKVVIADNLAQMVDHTFSIVSFAPPVELLLGSYFFAFQIYCDFSGYTDIALGTSALFGLTLMENFRRPYLARSTAEFWGERWHISLSHWFRDYLYIPLGGGRAGTLRRAANVMIVFMVSGLWHAGLGYGVGWTFLIWGALNGFYQWAGLATRGFWRRVGEALPRVKSSAALAVLRAIITFHLIAIAWVFFRAASIHDALVVLRRIGARLGDLPSLLAIYPFSTEQLTAFGLIGFLIGYEIVDERRPVFQRLADAPVAVRWGAFYLLIFALLLLGRWQAKEFIYMQF